MVQQTGCAMHLAPWPPEGSQDVGSADGRVRRAWRGAWKIPAEIISDAEVSLLFNMLDSHRSGRPGRRGAQLCSACESSSA